MYLLSLVFIRVDTRRTFRKLLKGTSFLMKRLRQKKVRNCSQTVTVLSQGVSNYFAVNTWYFKTVLK